MPPNADPTSDTQKLFDTTFKLSSVIAILNKNQETFGSTGRYMNNAKDYCVRANFVGKQASRNRRSGATFSYLDIVELIKEAGLINTYGPNYRQSVKNNPELNKKPASILLQSDSFDLAFTDKDIDCLLGALIKT